MTDHLGPRQGLAPAVADVIAAVLHADSRVSPSFFGSRRLGLVYRAFVICQVLDSPVGGRDVGEGVPGEKAAEVFRSYRLTGHGSENWIQVYEHTGAVVAAAVTIGKRMRLAPGHLADIRAAALLHDASKRADVELHGPLANSLSNLDRGLEDELVGRGYPRRIALAAMNTGRADRTFGSEVSRRRSIWQKGLIAGVVGLADTRTIGAHFCSLAEAQQEYLRTKLDAESVSFFTRHWLPYYLEVEKYLEAQVPGLALSITDQEIYEETVFPEVFGPNPSPGSRMRYAYARPTRGQIPSLPPGSG
jgi:hypothetical protein